MGRHKEKKEKKEKRKRKRESSESRSPSPVEKRARSPEASSSSQSGGGATGGSGAGDVISLAETNRIRAELGLAPLGDPSAGGSGGGGGACHETAPTMEQEEELVLVENMADKRRTEKLREKLEASKEKRHIDSKLSRVKGLADSDSEEDAAAWVSKVRAVDSEKQLAAKREKMLAEMDDQFGVSDLVATEMPAPKRQQLLTNQKREYTARDLTGLRVEHGTEEFKEGKTVILTLKDANILGDREEDGDVLENVNIRDVELAQRNKETKKKSTNYKAFEEEFDELGQRRDGGAVLSKYDEEIEGRKKSSFQLAGLGNYSGEQDKFQQQIREDLAASAQNLTLAPFQIASDFMTQMEMEKFKKPKKRVKKVRKRTVLKADDLLPEEGETAGGGVGETAAGVGGTENGVKQESMEVEEPDEEFVAPDEPYTLVEEEGMEDLQAALQRARRLRQKKEKDVMVKPEQYAAEIAAETLIKEEPEEDEADEETRVGEARSFMTLSTKLNMNESSEFCRSLGDIPTYGQSGNRDEDEDELLAFEKDLIAVRERQARKEEEESRQTNWETVDPTNEDMMNRRRKEADIGVAALINEETSCSSGVAGAMILAGRKGYLEKEKKKEAESHFIEHLKAQRFIQEDKNYELDAKGGRGGGNRDRYSGPVRDFVDKKDYQPVINLEYRDDDGHLLGEKEAFRFLSHKFHGKGSGKKKIEKRIKKWDEEARMIKMNSGDTPLNTAGRMKEKQLRDHQAFVVLSNNAAETGSSLIRKR